MGTIIITRLPPFAAGGGASTGVVWPLPAPGSLGGGVIKAGPVGLGPLGGVLGGGVLGGVLGGVVGLDGGGVTSTGGGVTSTLGGVVVV